MWDNDTKNVDFSSDSENSNFEFPNFDDFTSSFNSEKNENNNFENENNNFNSFPNFDINMLLKMKQIMDSMNSQNSNPRSNLLLSLKPYLRPERRQKVDQYIQLFNMEKVMENLKFTGGENR